MDRNEYIQRFDTTTDLKEKQLLIADFWNDCAKRGTTAVFTQAFIDNHIGKLSDSVAKNVAKVRSFNANIDFTSTILAESSINELVNIIATDVIPWFARNEFVFRNYAIDTKIQSITIKVSAAAGGGVQTGEAIQPVVGIDQRGIINHFHGPAEYATNDVFEKVKNKGVTEWRKRSTSRT